MVNQQHHAQGLRSIQVDSRPPRPPNGVLRSFQHAGRGLLYTIVCQRNMKAHVVSAILVGLVGSGIRLGLAEDVTLLFCVLLVFFAEILNTALEALVDLHTEAFDERARIAKDAAAAGVLVLAIGTILIFGAVLLANWRIIAGAGQQIARQAMAGVPLTAVAAGLLWGARRRWQLDLAMTIAGLVLLAALSTWTANWVFTAVTAGLFATCVAAARYRLTGGSGVPTQAGSGMQTR